MKYIKSISIVIPILNEAKNISRLTNKIHKLLTKINFEIIFVDDNSIDKSEKILINLKKKKLLNYIIRKKKRDLTQSCFEGIKLAKFPWVLIMDGDMQHDPKYIMPMIKLLNLKKSDMVIGIRNFNEYKKNNITTFIRINASILLKFLISFLLGFKSNDPLSGFFLFKKKIYFKNKKKFYGKGYKILCDFLYNIDKINISDFKIKFKQRKKGKSKMNFLVLSNLVIFIIKNFFKKLIK